MTSTDAAAAPVSALPYPASALLLPVPCSSLYSLLLPYSSPTSALLLLLSCSCFSLFLCASPCSLLLHLCFCPDPARPFLLQQELPSPALPLPCYYLYLVAPACPAPTLDPVLVRTFCLPVPVPRRTSLHLLIPCFFLSLRSPPYS